MGQITMMPTRVSPANLFKSTNISVTVVRPSALKCMGRINTTNHLTSSVNEIFVCTFHLGYPYFSPYPVKGASKVLE